MKNKTVSQENDIKNTETEIENLSIDNELEDIDYSVVAAGPLFVNPKHLKPGHTYRFVGDIPGEIERYKRYGFKVVIDEFEEINVGDNIASKTSRFGSAVTAKSKCGMILVLMTIRNELYAKYEAFLDKQSQERTKSLRASKVEGIPEHLQYFGGEGITEYSITNK